MQFFYVYKRNLVLAHSREFPYTTSHNSSSLNLCIKKNTPLLKYSITFSLLKILIVGLILLSSFFSAVDLTEKNKLL